MAEQQQAHPHRRTRSRSPLPHRTLIMGIVNVTPDSFSDGGKFFDTDAAIAHALELTEQGADIIDVGGESTRPGASRVPVRDELARVLPVVTELVHRGIRVSVDTMNAETASETVAAGAEFINDVSGGLARSGHVPGDGRKQGLIHRHALARPAQPCRLHRARLAGPTTPMSSPRCATNCSGASPR